MDPSTALVPTPSDPPEAPGAGLRILSRLAALGFMVNVVLCVVVAAGMAPLNTEWIPAWSGLALINLVAVYAHWTGRDWARGYGLGLALWALICTTQSTFVLGLQPLITAGMGGMLLLVAVQLLDRREGGPTGRHLLSMVLASTAVPCAVIYGLAPQHSWQVTAGVLGGALVVVSGAWGVCRGRTWGLLAGLAGAILISVTIAQAQHAGWLLHPHPLLPDSNPIALLGLGIAGAVLSFASTLPFLVPIIRFLRR